MNWTNEKPTQVGWYWFRKDRDSRAHPVKIYNAGVVFYPSLQGGDVYEMVRLNIQVPEPIKTKLDALRRHGTTASGFIRHLLERELKHTPTRQKGR